MDIQKTVDDETNQNAEFQTNRNSNLPVVIPVIAGVKNNITETEVCHEYEDVLDIIGFGKTQWIVLFTSGLLLMMVINETMGMSIVTIASQCDFSTTSQEKGLLGAAAFIGILCTSYFAAYLCDTIGRRPLLIYTTLCGNIFSFASIFTPYYSLFVFLRFLVGACIAGASFITYAYLGEFYVTRHRPVVINYACLFVGLSVAYVPAVAWLVLSMDWSFAITETFQFRPWRLLIVFNALPGFIAVLVMFALPESPKILMSMGKQKEAFEAVNKIAKMNTGRTLEDFKVYSLCQETLSDNDKILLTSKSASEVVKRMWQDALPLFKKPHVFNFLICCIIMCGVFLINSGMGLWYPEIQNRLGMKATTPMTICQVIDSFIDQQNSTQNSQICDDTITTKSYIDSLTFGLSFTAGYFVLGFILKPFGRKLTMVMAFGVAAFCGFLLHWLHNPIAIVVCFILFLILPGVCISVLSGAVVDLVPTHLRGKAVCVCLMLGRLGSIIGSNVVGAFLESYCNATFSVFYVLVLACAGLAMLLPIGRKS
ncbi:synaptic vesicle glycoprotein 2B-like [Glossina fuscipes]|uniref:Synaptic vesicle glycoprotein 2B-like n=1 Tax=Glossina fuscipes TaxID=7396 RepID=A0A8U0WJR4_9MUSC|nr:synaptic vesicle glycoprotein 2B-like [Glossina fuscipes]